MPAVNPGTTNLVAWWALDETSGNRLDSHGANHLTPAGSVSYAAGKVGNAADFERGTLDYLSIADNAALSVTGDFTLCAWVYLESVPVTGMVLSKGSFDSYSALEYGLAIQGPSAVPRFAVSYGATGSLVDWSGVISTGAWRFIVARKSATQIGLSIDGAAFVTAAATSTLSDKSNSLRIGDDGSARYFDGLIDEACIYKRALTADEITWLYNGGAGRAYSALAGGAPTMMQHHHAMLAGGRR